MIDTLHRVFGIRLLCHVGEEVGDEGGVTHSRINLLHT